MVLIVSEVTDRGSFDFIDDSGFIAHGLRTIVSGAFGSAIDFSDRRNPRWYTLGHISLLYADTMLYYEAWLNYPDQYHIISENPSLLTQGGEQVGEPEFFRRPGTNDIPLTLRWQMRESAFLSVFIVS